MLKDYKVKVLSLEFATRRGSTVFVLMDVLLISTCNVALKEGFGEPALQEGVEVEGFTYSQQIEGKDFLSISR